MSKVSSKLVAGVSKVKAKQAAVSASKKPMGADANTRRATSDQADKPVSPTVRADRSADFHPTPVWPD